jgi:hypothetical protein
MEFEVDIGVSKARNWFIIIDMKFYLLGSPELVY